MTISSCSSAPTIDPPLNDNKIEEISLNLEKEKLQIPLQFLQECEWISPLEGDQISDLAETSIDNVEKQEACYYLHNEFVDYYKTKIKPLFDETESTE